MKIMHNIFLVTLLISSVNRLQADNYTTIVTTYNNPLAIQDQEIGIYKAFLIAFKGSLVGTLTGVGCHYLDNYMPKGCSWFVTMALREAWVQSLMNDIKKRNKKEIDEDQLLRFSAHSTSWMSYFFCKTA